METEFRSGRTVSQIIAPLLFLLILSGSAAAQSSSEQAYRDARTAASAADFPTAATKADAALRRFGKSDDEWVWALRILRAEIRVKQRDNAVDPMIVLRPELPPRLRNSEAAVHRCLALGIAAYYAEGDSISWFRKALAIAERHQPHLRLAAHQALGNSVEDLPEAERHLRAVARLAKESGNEIAAASVIGILSQKYSVAERYAEAVDIGEEALARFVALNATGKIASAAGNLGWAYSEIGDDELASDLFEQAEAAAEKIGNQTERVVWSNHLGNVAFARRRFSDAEKHYTRSLALGRAIADKEVPVILTNLARVAVETGRYDDARRFNAEALKRKRATNAGDRDDDELRSLIVDARIAGATNDAARAEKTLREVVAETKNKATRWEAQSSLAQLYVRLGRNSEAETQFRAATETVRDARNSIENPERRMSFFNVASEMFDAYVDFLIRNDKVFAALTVTETIRAQTLEEGLAATSTPVRAIDPRVIAKQSGATILSYWLGRERSFLWVITPASIRVSALPPDTKIETEVERYRRDLEKTSQTIQLSGARGEALYRMLVGRASIARGSRVIVIADGRLHALNFETLVAPAPRRYWIEDVIVTNASSLQLLARKRAGRPATEAMLLIGNPPAPKFPPLPRAGEEIASIARHFDRRTILAGTNATPSAYRGIHPEKFDFVHFVAHGVASRKRPLDSAVILAQDASGHKLFARDIVLQRLGARLVTISSCHGAGTRTFSGEGLVGLAWAFLGAGAEQVIAALWEVNDSATPELMDRMYAGIRAGRDPAVALRDAKLTLVRRKDAYRKAVYWAPFVLYSGS